MCIELLIKLKAVEKRRVQDEKVMKESNMGKEGKKKTEQKADNSC